MINHLTGSWQYDEQQQGWKWTDGMTTPKKSRNATKDIPTMKEIIGNFPIMYPYSVWSKGGRALAKELGMFFYDRRKVSGTQFGRGNIIGPRSVFQLINWGVASDFRELKQYEAAGYGKIEQVYNRPENIRLANNKYTFFETVKDVARIPESTDSFRVAMDWVDNGLTVLGRSFRGTCGKDITFIEDDLERFANSDFWVQYKKKKDEFRVHIAFGDVIAIQKKALRKTDPQGRPIDTSQVDFRIRNLYHGFVFKRNDIIVPNDVVDQARLAIHKVGLDFGAIDVIWNQAEGKAYVLEINTAPGLEGTTVLDYANAFRKNIPCLNKKE